MTKRKKAPALPGVPPPLKKAFWLLSEKILDDPEREAAFLLAWATTGLEDCAEKIAAPLGYSVIKEKIFPPGTLDTVWREIRKNWREMKSPRSWPNEQEWLWFLEDVLILSYADPEYKDYQSAMSNQALGVFSEIAKNAENLECLLNCYIPGVSEASYSREVENLAIELKNTDFADQLLRLVETCRSVERAGFIAPKLPESQFPHTSFFRSVAVTLREYQIRGGKPPWADHLIFPLRLRGGAPPKLFPRHLVIFGKVVDEDIRATVENPDRDEANTLREAAMDLQKYGPIFDKT